MSVSGYISASLLNTILDVAEANGAARGTILSALALDDPSIKPCMQIPMQKLVSLFDIISKNSSNPAIGLTIGCNIRPGSLNALGYALMSSKNLYEALQLQKSLGGLISNCAPLEINLEHPSQVVVSYTIIGLEPDTARPFHDMFLSMFWRYAKWITRTEGVLTQVCFTHAPPLYIDEYLNAFGLSPQFGQKKCQLIFDKKYLRDPLYQADDHLNSLMREQAASLIQSTKANSSLSAKVALQIRQLMPQQKATLSLVAKGLHVSERTLSRKLKSEGHSFKSVLLDVRESLALEYLRNQQVSVNEIASKLGYLDYSSFSHAFRCWTGLSPTEYREQQAFGPATPSSLKQHV